MGNKTDTDLEKPAPVAHNISDSDTDIEMEEPAPAFHAADAKVAQTARRRRRNSNGDPVAPLTRSRAKQVKRLSDHLSPAISCRLAGRRLLSHNAACVFCCGLGALDIALCVR
ncbi:unnamed protein product [Laminaria digitata]